MTLKSVSTLSGLRYGKDFEVRGRTLPRRIVSGAVVSLFHRRLFICGRRFSVGYNAHQHTGHGKGNKVLFYAIRPVLDATSKAVMKKRLLLLNYV